LQSTLTNVMPSQPAGKSLVLVVGAGASKEANLPVGGELKQQIANVLDIRYDSFGYQMTKGDRLINETFRVLASIAEPRNGNVNPYLQAAHRMRDAMPLALSIDNFIDSHRSDEKIEICGKLAIARCILKAEASSILQVDRRNIYNKINFTALESTWYNAFFQLLTETCQQADLAQRLSRVAIICFNYDRCVEHYLHSALQHYYAMKPEEAAAALTNLEIHHPYGTVGKLPWQHQGEEFDFGATPEPPQLLALAAELRTFTEGIDPKRSNISAIRSALASANRIAFLGFAYHRLNLQLLFPGLADGDEAGACSVYATAHGISPADLEEIKQELKSVAGIRHNRIHLRNDLKCSDLFREFWRSLSLQ
jgi:hypothetical protein